MEMGKVYPIAIQQILIMASFESHWVSVSWNR